MTEEVKIRGWIAKNGVSNDRSYMYIYDNNIIFSEIKPTRDEHNKHWNFAKFYLDPKEFPDLKWEDEPRKVELIIRESE